MTIAIYYGSTTGNTMGAAEKIKELWGDAVVAVENVATVDPKSIQKYDMIIFGLSTWNIGELQEDWKTFLPKMAGLDLTGKKVAFFAMGDAKGYPDNFLDCVGEAWETISTLGSPQIVGLWSIAGYDFTGSKGLWDENNFIGLALDNDNEPDLTNGRIATWLAALKDECDLKNVP